MNQTNYDIAIIGVGISGLSLANLLANMDRKVLLLDKANRAGGVIDRLEYQDFTIDMGAHTAYNSYVTFIELMEQSSNKEKLQERKKQKYYFTTNTGFKKITSLLNFGSLLINIPKILKTKKKGKSVQEYFSIILGSRNYHKFARHFFKAVLCQNADNYPAPYFLKRRDKRNKNYPKNFTFKKGLKTYTDTLYNHPNINFYSSSKVNNITKDEDGFTINTTSDSYNVKDIAFACYADEASLLIKEIAPKLSKALDAIKYTNVSSYGIVVPAKDIKDKVSPFAGLLTTSDDFTSIVSRDTVEHNEFRGFVIHSEGEKDIMFLKKKLCENLNISEDIILAEKYKMNRLPSLTKEHENILNEIVEQSLQQDNLFITGNYFQGLSLEDCIQRSKSEALRYISR